MAGWATKNSLRTRKRIFRASLISLFLIFHISSCDKPPQTESDNLLSYLLKPSLAMYGDSVIAGWPIEKQLSEFNGIKFAFPVRNTHLILSSITSDHRRYDACLYEGGVNDFLNNYAPDPTEVDATIDRQIQGIQILQTRCTHVIALNIWNVKFPWPTLAAAMITAKMKERINFIPRIDTELLITDDMIPDGAHPNELGYEVLSKAVREQLKPFFPILYLNE
ncbi:SGNH/GDSL hydrolase family protein [Leptospira neocaledonica]|uniref:SGNH/GDSL hydrolase family protein n=1 Tax=Leptospira neocaledonica TaxID=2023192 RepID=A0A2M9ZVK3_9LEPT|nr:SGNH/GDSL hydrolase family protein [Leptospira neocaledonica]PJZ76049.1 SGNH/GDSL hydrolase family protein [Leptospira neocaledonica]